MSFGLYLFRRCFFVRVCLAVVFSALVECTVKLTLHPINPTGVVGEDMRLNCTLTNKTLSWEDLAFTMSYYSRPKHHPIPATAIRKLSDSSAELTLRNLTDRQHRAVVSCLYTNQAIAHQIIKVGRPPAVPKIYYQRYLDWQEFVFRWKIRPKENGFDTPYIAWFKSSRQLDFTPCNKAMCFLDDKSKCPPYQINDTCHITTEYLEPAKYDGWLQFKVNATNTAGSATSDNFRLFLNDVIEPGPVTELSVSSGFSADIGRLVDIVWFRQQKELKTFIFEILMKSMENPEDQRNLFEKIDSGLQRDMSSIILKDLNPFTVYKLSIRSKVEDVGKKKRFWSKWSDVTFKSHEEVPLTSPDVCQCCFEVDEDSIQRTVLVYFKPLTKDESRGNVSYDLEYKTTTVESLGLHLNSTGVDNKVDFLFNNTQPMVSNYSMSERTKTIQWNKSGTAVFRLKLLKTVQYELNVNAKTKAGHSPTKSTTVLIPTQSQLLDLQPPANCSVMSVDGIDENRIVFRWNRTLSVGGHALKHVTVFWCKAFLNSMRCQHTLNWRELGPEAASVNISLTESYEGYLFGIGHVLKNNHSSGIHWACSYFKKNAVASPPHLFSLEIDETRVIMKLDKPNYNSKEGLVYGFNLYYSSVDDEGQQHETKVTKVYVEDRSTRGIVTIEGLKSGASYTFKAETLTVAGPSYANVSVSVVTRPFRLTANELSWIIVAAVVIGIFAVVGFSCCIRWPHGQWIKLKRWIKFEPCMPSVVLDEREEKQKNSSYPEYSIVSESAALNNEPNQILEQMEEDQIKPGGPDRHPEDIVPPYSWITPRRDFREDCDRRRRLLEEMDILNVGFRHLLTVPENEHILPLLERSSDLPNHHQLLPNPAEMSEQSALSSNGTTVNSDVDQTSLSNCYLPVKTIGDDVQSLTSNEQLNPVSQHMVDHVLSTDNSHIANHVLSKHHKPPTTGQDPPANHILPSQNELVNEAMTCQILPTTSQQVRNNILPELSHNADVSMADHILPISSQRMNVNVMDIDQLRPKTAERILRSADRSTFDRSGFDRPVADVLLGQSIVSGNANSREQINPFSQHMIHNATPSHQRILPKLLETGCDFNTRAEISSIAEVHGRNKQTQREIRNCSSSPTSSSAAETSSRSEDDSGGRRAKPYAPNSLEDDEGIYL